MAVSLALRRLLRVRDLEEEQCRLALESAVGELNRLGNALAASSERSKQGRQLVLSSARSGELPDRLSGIEEAHAAERFSAVLTPRLAAKELDVLSLRRQYLEKRVERRQAETLIEESEAQDAIEALRRGQQGLDDWYGSHRYRRELEEEGARPGISGTAAQKPAMPESKSAAKKT